MGFTLQDDCDLEDMMGTDVDHFNELPVEELKEYGQMDMNDMPRRSHAIPLEDCIHRHCERFHQATAPWIQWSQGWRGRAPRCLQRAYEEPLKSA